MIMMIYGHTITKKIAAYIHMPQYGIRSFWLDADEGGGDGEGDGGAPPDETYFRGSQLEVSAVL